MPLPAYFQDQHNREKLLTRYKTLQAISPELFEHGSGVASSLLAQLDGGNSHSSNPEPDYFSALDLPQRERKYSDATSLVVPGHRPASRLSVSTGAFPLDSNVSFYGFKTEDDDAASTADTLSEWGLEHLFETSSAGKSHARQRSTSTTHSLAHSLALYQPRSTTPLDPVPSDEPGDWEEDAPQVQAVNFEGRTNGQPRVRRASNASVLTTQTVNSSTGFSRPSTPQLPSRPGSALSRFDPGRTFGDHSVDLDYLARQQAVDARPRWYDQHHRPDVLIMPEPLATPQDWEREAEVEQNLDVEEQEEEPEQHAEVCSIPSLRSSGDSTRSSQKDSHQSVEQEKQQKEELEELAINKVPAGKLFGHSLMDELERRQAQNKSRARLVIPIDPYKQMD